VIRALAKEFESVVALNMVREQHHANVWMIPSNPSGSKESLVGLSRWHPDIQDYQRRALRSQQSIEVVDVSGLARDLKIGSFQDAGQALSKEN